MKRFLCLCAGVLMLTTCTGTHTAATHTTGTPTTLGRPGCKPPSPITRGNGFPEVEGTSSRIQLWGLIMAEGPDDPVHLNTQVKIVWRMTGAGDPRLTSIAPDGRTHRLQWGPDQHLSSTYRRPGQEWGAGYLFTQPGCWDLHATRGNATADVWLTIAP